VCSSIGGVGISRLSGHVEKGYADRPFVVEAGEANTYRTQAANAVAKPDPELSAKLFVMRQSARKTRQISRSVRDLPERPRNLEMLCHHLIIVSFLLSLFCDHVDLGKREANVRIKAWLA